MGRSQATRCTGARQQRLPQCNLIGASSAGAASASARRERERPTPDEASLMCGLSAATAASRQRLIPLACSCLPERWRPKRRRAWRAWGHTRRPRRPWWARSSSWSRWRSAWPVAEWGAGRGAGRGCWMRGRQPRTTAAAACGRLPGAASEQCKRRPPPCREPAPFPAAPIAAVGPSRTAHYSPPGLERRRTAPRTCGLEGIL